MGRAAPPCSSCPRGATVYTGTGAGQSSVAALVSPRDPTPSGGQEHYTAQEAFTLDGGPTSPDTPETCGSPDLTAPLGPNTVPSWLGGPEPVSGNFPRVGAGRRGCAWERGQPQLSPALLTRPCYYSPCPRAQCLGTPPPTLTLPWGHLGLGLSGCLPAAPARVGASASGSNEAK